MEHDVVTVLGLGAMGTALARALLVAGHPVTVWNRTPARADALVGEGARPAPDPASAVAASPLTIVCLLDHAAVRTVLDGVDLAGTTLVNLTSGTPEHARATAAWLAERGAEVLAGTIMVPTPLVGPEEGLVLYSGSAAVHERHRTTLEALGRTELLGDDPGRAALFDLGMLDVFFAGLASFLHAAAVVGRDGVPAGEFVRYAEEVVAILPATFRGLAKDVDAGTHPGDEDNLVMDAAALAHIVATSRARGVDPALPELVHGLARRAIDRGHGGDGFSRVVDELRSPRRPGAAAGPAGAAAR
ncbi:NAD(P)-dependent oxidoreductase [Actinomycetospora straminea]|uniref:NAD(P)-dependent oxidoreductase n=1 Tax=Actinomycetospora straminea TaxID=663607 RepID=A0ABP9EHG9_9PSEU|nr:NAD(P)-binding domain-containing protein [Actinomycetospora straminea]MDD7935659.1 NAD(P)-binding domain-containing protein [Actinomycetospora straminea]